MMRPLTVKKTATANLLGITAQGTLMHSFLGMLLVRFPSIKKKVFNRVENQ